MNKYIITGNTYGIKEELKKYNCNYSVDKKAWLTGLIKPGSSYFLELELLCKSNACYINKIAQTEHAKKIQSILIKGNK